MRTTTVTLPLPPSHAMRALRAAARLLTDMADRIQAQHPPRPPKPGRDDTTTGIDTAVDVNTVRPCPRCNIPPMSVYKPRTFHYSGGRTQTRTLAYCRQCQRTYSLPTTTEDP